MNNNRKILIGLCGKAKSGKDVIADYIITQYGGSTYAFADPLKKAATEIFGIPIEDFHDQNSKEVRNNFWELTPREILQKLGTEGGRDVFGHDLWTKRAQVEINTATSILVITDCRFENEAQLIRDNGGDVLHIDRELAGLDGNLESHASEQQLKIMESDYVIENNESLEELYLKVDEFFGTVYQTIGVSP